MNQNGSRPGRLAATEPLKVNQHLQRNAETDTGQIVPALLREAARALRVQPSQLPTWTCERARQEALEALRVIEGQREILDRHADALAGLLAQLRRVPGGARYVSDLKGGAK